MKNDRNASMPGARKVNEPPKKLRVAFDFDDTFYSTGMWQILQDIFTKGRGIPLLRLPLAPASCMLPQADIYVSRFIAGTEVTCRPEFRSRNQQGLLVMVSEGTNPPQPGRMTDCLQNSVVLRKEDNLENIHKKIIRSWDAVSDGCLALCAACCAVHLSGNQERIATWLSQSIPVSLVARRLQIHPKKVSAHKRAAMKKLNLSTNAELMEFMKNWADHVSR